MKVKSVIHKGIVHAYVSVNGEPVRVSTGIKAKSLNADGLLTRSSGVTNYKERNEGILLKRKKLFQLLSDFPNVTQKHVTHYFKTGELPVLLEQEEETEIGVVKAFSQFIEASKTGERLTKKGTKVAPSTIKSYGSVLGNLKKFAKLRSLSWENLHGNFYQQFCNYCWDELKYFDNYTGNQVKILKSFVKWCHSTKIITTPIDTTTWQSWKEDIEILVLYRDEIKLIYEMPISCRLTRTSEMLERTRDIFLLGVFTCFRIQHLLSLTEQDLVVLNGEYYLKAVVQKTKKVIRIKLNPVGVFIIQKYRHQFRTLLPKISDQKFNENLKALAKYFKDYIGELRLQGKLQRLIGNNWNNDFRRIRTRRGVPHFEFIAPEEFISSHVMRRSGITFLLMAGLSPYEVSAISGHVLNSKDFVKYVKIASSEVETKSINAWNHALM